MNSISVFGCRTISASLPVAAHEATGGTGRKGMVMCIHLRDWNRRRVEMVRHSGPEEFHQRDQCKPGDDGAAEHQRGGLCADDEADAHKGSKRIYADNGSLIGLYCVGSILAPEGESAGEHLISGSNAHAEKYGLESASAFGSRNKNLRGSHRLRVDERAVLLDDEVSPYGGDEEHAHEAADDRHDDDRRDAQAKAEEYQRGENEDDAAGEGLAHRGQN